jgi:signal transduction histidine kinase
MILQHAFALGTRWILAVAALWILLSMLISGQIEGVNGAAGTLLVLGALAIAIPFPRAAFVLAVVGAIVAAGTSPYYSWWLLLLALAAAAVATWGIEPLRIRLLSGVPVAVLGAVALASLDAVGQQRGYPISALHFSPILNWGVMMLVWGAAVGARALYDALRAESAKQQAVARTTVVESELRDERLRADLTHDFHDVMAHSLAVLAAQAEGLRLTYEAHPERIGPVLTTISDTARLALVEVRQLLERVDDDARRPQATSADIPGLVAQLRSAGPTVVLHDLGAHGYLARTADIAAYRIVQESLTNALRHGGADSDITVTLAWTGPGLSLAVSSPIRDRTALGPTGRGIAGMHERARIAGGSLEIDAEGDRFVVSAYLPYTPITQEPTSPLTEDQLSTLPVPMLPVPTQPPAPRPEDVVAPWIVEATRLHRQRHPGQPESWAQATTVDLTQARLPDGRIPNPAAPSSPTPGSR